jgi:uncharacterized protein (DUF983 family)
MSPCEYLGSTFLLILLVAFILTLTRAASSARNTVFNCCRLTLTADVKNRIAGVAILVVGAIVIGILKSCATNTEAKFWLETLTVLATGLTSALAAVFIREGFKGYKDDLGKAL